MKIKKNIPATETGRVAGDYSGSRNYNFMPERVTGSMNEGRTPGGPAPVPNAKAPDALGVNGGASAVANQARVKSTGKGPQLGITTKPTGPHPAGLQKSVAPKTPNLGPSATRKPKKNNHPFFGSNEYGY